MSKVPWASPEALKGLTIPHLLMLGREHAPGEERLTDQGDFLEDMARRDAARAASDRAWRGEPES